MNKNFKVPGALLLPHWEKNPKPNNSLVVSVYRVTASLPAFTHKKNVSGYFFFITA